MLLRFFYPPVLGKGAWILRGAEALLSACSACPCPWLFENLPVLLHKKAGSFADPAYGARGGGLF